MTIETPPTAPHEPPKKLDPFRPDMPQIPGVGISGTGQSDGAGWANAENFKKIGIAAVVVVTLGLLILWLLKRETHPTVESPSADQPIPVSSEPAPVPPTSTLATGPASFDGRIQAAAAEDLPEAWSSKKFVFVKPFTRDAINSIVIRLPGGSYWAFALEEPSGRCELEYVKDLASLATQYHYAASHPMVVSPCTGTVYDPLKVGAMGGNIFVRGDVVRGSGTRPPISIDVEKSGNSIIADGIE